MLGCAVAKFDVTRERAKKRNTLSDENWHASDGESLNESGAQKALNRNSAVDIGVLSATRSKLSHNLRWLPAHLFDFTSSQC